MRPSRSRLVAVWLTALLLTGLVALKYGVGAGPQEAEAEAAALDSTTTSTTFVLPPLPTTLPPTTTTVTPTTTTTAPPAPPPTLAAAAAPVRDLGHYAGLGTWIDVYDWSETFNRYAEARVSVADIDRMADVGVQTLYVQTSKWDAPTDVLEPERLLPLISRAKARGLSVVAWYLPTFENPQADMHRLMEASRIPGVDALAVDIESLKFPDVAERNRRLVEISTNLRAALPDVALGAIPYPPVVTDVINPRLWPDFPWTALAPLYDVWLPMSYQSDRKPDSGYRDAYRYTAENIDRMRARLGLPTVPVHTIGGIADRTSTADVAAMHRAALERRVLGGSLYDWKTSGPDLWPSLHVFRK
jgi:hypothetical protein